MTDLDATFLIADLAGYTALIEAHGGAEGAAPEVVPAHGSRGAALVDPVCRMRVSAEGAPARLPWDGRTYHFCSFDCVRRFATRPEDYAGRG